MKTHNYKSLEDVISAMLDGQVFYDVAGCKVYWTNAQGIEIGFFVEHQPGVVTGVNSFVYWRKWQIKTHWTDNLSHETPVLCKVWDSDQEDVWYDFITKYIQPSVRPYRGVRDDYINAEPVKPEDCWQGDIEEVSDVN